MPRRNPKLYSEITIALPQWLQLGAAWLSVLSMGALIAVMVAKDVDTLRTQSLSLRIAQHSLTSLELALVWSLVGAGLYGLA
ncbi:MAG: hypothetical protein DMF70_16510 [Acidobacteria bacterium]|nr:MAG: hypothetical protein DMF70_16510 [Acidobacteriota bacterium]